jgi:AhpD family alkylhydroperoxidase
MYARMKNPAMIVPGAMQAAIALSTAAHECGVPATTLELVHLRASQINGCSVCVFIGVQGARKAGDSDRRLHMVSAWQDAPWFTDAERAALALCECVTRTADRQDPVPDAVWNEAARHYDEKALAALLLTIGTTNLWNRLNVPTRQVAGEWAGQ